MLAKNEGTTDRLVRATVGGSLLALSAASLAVTGARPLGIVAAVAGAVLLFTAASGSCQLYRPLGIDTSKERNGSTE